MAIGTNRSKVPTARRVQENRSDGCEDSRFWTPLQLGLPPQKARAVGDRQDGVPHVPGISGRQPAQVIDVPVVARDDADVAAIAAQTCWTGRILGVRRSMRWSRCPRGRRSCWCRRGCGGKIGALFAGQRRTRCGAHGMGDQLVQLPESFRERGGSGLKDVGRFDLVDVAVLDGGRLVPIGTGLDGRLPYRLATPGSNDELRVPGCYLRRAHDPIGRQALGP